MLRKSFSFPIVDPDEEIRVQDAGQAASLRAESDLFTGSFFDAGGRILGKALHWRRHLVAHGFPYALFVIDVVLVALLYLLAVDLRYDGPALEGLSRRVLLILAGSSVASLYFIGGYEYHRDMRRGRFASEHAIVSLGALLVAFLLVYTLTFYGTNLKIARSTVFLPMLAFPVLSIVYRNRLAHLKEQLRRGNAICIIGTGFEARDLYRRLRAAGSTQTTYVADDREESIGEHLLPEDVQSPEVRRLGEVRLDSSMDDKFVESYIVAKPLGSLPQNFIKRLVVAQFSGNRVYTYESFLAEVLRIIPPTRLSLAWAFSDGFRLNRRLTYDRVKRVSDLLLALVGLILLSPVIALVAWAVRLTSPGPVIFKQVRVGEKEKPFMVYKFRSMRIGSDEGPKYTQIHDSRFTPIGAFIRQARLDELPQLWNVVKGEMSVIGPRAEWIDLVKGYEKKFPFYHFRHAVKPGITGWAQVNYSYGASDSDTLEKLNYDLYYVRHYSLLLDVTICVKTVYMMLFARGR
jgi:exopolysaccharide biosynthesis polyprenyl glycosylphosphotransferase